MAEEIETQPDWICELRDQINRYIKGVLRVDPGLKRRFKGILGTNSFSTEVLDSLITPSMQRKQGDVGEYLEIVFPCNASNENGSWLSECIEFDVAHYNFILGKNSRKLETILDTDNLHSDLLKKTLNVIERTKSNTKNLYTVEYSRQRNYPLGRLKIIVRKGLADKPDGLAELLFRVLWGNVILNKDRIESLLSIEKEERAAAEKNGASSADETPSLSDLGLEIYKGKETFASIGGYKSLVETIKRDALYPLLHPEVYSDIEKGTTTEVSSSGLRALLFYGPAGTGKTLMARVIANEQKINLVYLSLSKVISKWMGEGVQNLEKMFNAVEKYSKENGKTILFIDEVDTFGSRNTESSAADTDDRRLINAFLTRLDGFSSTGSNLMVIGATNNHLALDKAIRSRFATEVYFPLPTREDRLGIAQLYAKHLSASELEKIAATTEGFCGRDLKNMAVSARNRKAKDIIEDPLRQIGQRTEMPTIDYYINAIEDIRKKSGTNITQEAKSAYS